MDLLEFPSTEAEFRGRFADEDQCREYLARLKWPEGFRCAHCAGDRAYFLPSKRVVYECAGCGRQVSIIAGTIFEALFAYRIDIWQNGGNAGESGRWTGRNFRLG